MPIPCSCASLPLAGAGQLIPAALLARLPHGTRGKLLHLAVADHPVDVTTDRGHALVLIRLSDAIAETAPTPGLQVHRSHWVALDAVRGTRQVGKPVLHLQNGTVSPSPSAIWQLCVRPVCCHDNRPQSMLPPSSRSPWPAHWYCPRQWPA